MNYRVGDVVCSNYGKFNGDTSVGIFLVIYSEREDRRYTDCHSNYNLLKITSNNLLGDGYTVRLYKGDGGLDNDSLVNVSKIHTVSKDQVYKKIGSLEQHTMLRIYKELKKFNNEVEYQVMERL